MSNWFFVYIIESPSAVDIYHNRAEGGLLKQALSLHGIPCVVRVTVSREAFLAAMQIGLVQAMESIPNLIPIIHISAHGSADGIQLSDLEIISWNELRELLLPVNTKMNDSLLLSMSSCEGFAACRMAMRIESSQHPFLAMVGHTGKPYWPDTAIAFTTLYHQLAKKANLRNAVDAMKIASGDDGFLFTTAEKAQKGYSEYWAGIDAKKLQEDLRQQLPGGWSYRGWAK